MLNNARDPALPNAAPLVEQDELSRFKPDASINEDTNIYQWFLDNKNNYPNLYKIHLKNHYVPAGSVASEQLFSRPLQR